MEIKISSEEKEIIYKLIEIKYALDNLIVKEKHFKEKLSKF